MAINKLIFGKYLESVPNNEALRYHSIDGLERSDMIGVGGQESLGDGLGGIFTWSPSSTAADDDLTVIKPYDLPVGRWVVIGRGVPGPQGPAGSGGGSGTGDMLKSDNLAGLTNYTTARTNLGVSATGMDPNFTTKINNLSDLSNIATARINLGLGSAAVLIAGASAGNVPVLDGTGKLQTSTLPSIAITDTFIVASDAAMIALTAQRGDVAIRTDTQMTYILATDSPGTLGDWKQLLVPANNITGNAATATALQTGRTIATTGDLVFTTPAFNGTTNITTTATLATVNSNVGTFGGSGLIPTITVNAKGLVTAVTSAPTNPNFTINFTAAADAYIPARIAMTVSQGNAPLGSATIAYAVSTAGAPGTFTTTTLPVAVPAGAWLKVTASAVTGFVALDLYRSA